MEILKTIMQFVMECIYHLPNQLAPHVHDGLDLGLGLTPDQLTDIFVGSEVLGTIVVVLLLGRKILKYFSKAVPVPVVDPVDEE